MLHNLKEGQGDMGEKLIERKPFIYEDIDIRYLRDTANHIISLSSIGLLIDYLFYVPSRIFHSIETSPVLHR